MNSISIPKLGKRLVLPDAKGAPVIGQHAQQRMVKDAVVFVQPLDPFALLASASQRMADGESVFFPGSQSGKAAS